MANTRSFSPLPPPRPLPAAPAAPAPVPAATGCVPSTATRSVDVADFLPPGATWLPAPQHTLPDAAGPAADDRLPGARTGRPAAAARRSPPAAGPAATRPTEPRPPAATRSCASTPSQRTAEVDGRALDLTYLEFELLAHLVAHPHRVHTRDQLVTTVWGYGHVGDGRTVDVHIARLRRKLGAEHRRAIQTVRRVGYKYTPPTGR